MVGRMREGAKRFVQGFMEYTTNVAMDPAVETPLVSDRARANLAGFTGYMARKLAADVVDAAETADVGRDGCAGGCGEE